MIIEYKDKKMIVKQGDRVDIYSEEQVKKNRDKFKIEVDRFNTMLIDLDFCVAQIQNS